MPQSLITKPQYLEFMTVVNVLMRVAERLGLSEDGCSIAPAVDSATRDVLVLLKHGDARITAEPVLRSNIDELNRACQALLRGGADFSVDDNLSVPEAAALEDQVCLKLDAYVARLV